MVPRLFVIWRFAVALSLRLFAVINTRLKHLPPSTCQRINTQNFTCELHVGFMALMAKEYLTTTPMQNSTVQLAIYPPPSLSLFELLNKSVYSQVAYSCHLL